MAAKTRLFVGNLPENFCENDIKDGFSSYGDIINIDIKAKPNAENEHKKFAFVTLSTSDYNIESCLKYFSSVDFHGNRLYVTRARESFLERLQREREQAQKKDTPNAVNSDLPKTIYAFEKSVNHKRKFIEEDDFENNSNWKSNKFSKSDKQEKYNLDASQNISNDVSSVDKKQESEKKRLESIKRKRQEFKEKKMIIKTGLTGIDNVSNKKIIFSDNDNYTCSTTITSKKKSLLLDDDGSGDDINFDIKEQFEGIKGQKVLDLQSTYKSDKRFVLDERFAEDNNDEYNTNRQNDGETTENVELSQADEKSKQLNILQDLLGVPIKTKSHDHTSKIKTKLGMLRFDPLQPDHAKFLAPVEPKQESNKKSKKKKAQDNIKEPEPVTEVEKVEVSKEQFYAVSDVLKEAITQPTAFSLRSLFSKNENNYEDRQDQETQSIPLETKNKKAKNPLEPGERNPFVYDSSESEDEEELKHVESVQKEKTEVKAVWKENLFFSQFDNRLKDGLEFFNKSVEGEVQKERRQLKSVMKKRLYNKERKTKMFQKKIGGRKKTLKKSYRKNNP